MGKMVYVNEQYGRVTMTEFESASGKEVASLEVNGIVLGTSAAAAIAGFFDNLSDEDNPWR